jgi:hypothetical protein
MPRFFGISRTADCEICSACRILAPLLVLGSGVFGWLKRNTGHIHIGPIIDLFIRATSGLKTRQ